MTDSVDADISRSPSSRTGNQDRRQADGNRSYHAGAWRARILTFDRGLLT